MGKTGVCQCSPNRGSHMEDRQKPAPGIWGSDLALPPTDQMTFGGLLYLFRLQFHHVTWGQSQDISHREVGPGENLAYIQWIVEIVYLKLNLFKEKRKCRRIRKDWKDMLGPDFAALEFQATKFRFCLDNGERAKVLSRSVTQRCDFGRWIWKQCMERAWREVSGGRRTS